MCKGRQVLDTGGRGAARSRQSREPVRWIDWAVMDGSIERVQRVAERRLRTSAMFHRSRCESNAERRASGGWRGEGGGRGEMEEEEKVQRLRWSSTQRVGSGKSWLCAVERERDGQAGKKKKVWTWRAETRWDGVEAADFSQVRNRAPGRCAKRKPARRLLLSPAQRRAEV